MSDSIKELQQEIIAFRDERNWKQFHNPKDLAISISLEAAELLEVFQWSGADVAADKKIDKIKEELAVTSRCMPFNDQEQIANTCVCCGKPAHKLVYWGKAY